MQWADLCLESLSNQRVFLFTVFAIFGALFIACFFFWLTWKVWEVKLWKTDPARIKNEQLISSARVTLVCSLPVPAHLGDVSEPFRRYAKL